MNKEKAARMRVVTDSELEGGIFKIGAKYHIRTPSYQYIGTLQAVTEDSFMFSDTATVYDTGPYPEFYAGGGNDIQKHEGAGEMVLNRGGVVLHRFLK